MKGRWRQYRRLLERLRLRLFEPNSREMGTIISFCDFHGFTYLSFHLILLSFIVLTYQRV